MTENLRVCVCVSIYNNIIYRHIYIYVYVLLYIITYNNITAYSLRRAVKCSLAPLTGVNKSAWKIKKKCLGCLAAAGTTQLQHMYQRSVYARYIC